MRKVIIATLIIIITTGSLLAETATLKIKNASLFETLKVECTTSNTSALNRSAINIKPGKTGAIKINLERLNDDLNIKFKGSVLEKDIALAFAKDYFGNVGLEYTDDYTDENIFGDINENHLYKNISIQL